jgi:hypothetical protein
MVTTKALIEEHKQKGQYGEVYVPTYIYKKAFTGRGDKRVEVVEDQYGLVKIEELMTY